MDTKTIPNREIHLNMQLLAMDETNENVVTALKHLNYYLLGSEAVSCFLFPVFFLWQTKEESQDQFSVYQCIAFRAYVLCMACSDILNCCLSFVHWMSLATDIFILCLSAEYGLFPIIQFLVEIGYFGVPYSISLQRIFMKSWYLLNSTW